MSQNPPTTTFPAPVFAALTPAPFLHAHLTQDPPTRPSQRSPSTARAPALNVGSLTHAHGSAVVRAGDTAVVVGVRAQVLLASDVPLNAVGGGGSGGAAAASTVADALSGDDDDDDDDGPAGAGGGVRRAHELLDMLVVPNVELATGCSADQIPGSAPSSVAQSIAFQLKDLLLSLGVIEPSQLEIWSSPTNTSASSSSSSDSSSSSSSQSTNEADSAYESDRASSPSSTDKALKKQLKAYHVLHIDCLVLSLAGPPLAPLWLALLAALRTTRLPATHYSTTSERVLSDARRGRARPLCVRGLPAVCEFAVFEAARHKGLRGDEARQQRKWVLADVDALEQAVCEETVLLVVDCGPDDGDTEAVEADEAHEADGEDGLERVRIRRLQKRGGLALRPDEVRGLLELARRQWVVWSGILGDL